MTLVSVPARTRLSSVLACSAAALITVGCGGSGTRRSSAELEIAPQAVQSTHAEPAAIFVPSFDDDHKGDRYVSVFLAIPDGSAVLQFTDPVADLTVVSENSRLELNGVSCSLEVGGGSRSFRFFPRLTRQQIDTLKSIRVNRLYDRADETK